LKDKVEREKLRQKAGANVKEDENNQETEDPDKEIEFWDFGGFFELVEELFGSIRQARDVI